MHLPKPYVKTGHLSHQAYPLFNKPISGKAIVITKVCVELFLILRKKKMTRILLIALLIAFNFCYMEWGGGNSAFIFQGQYTFFTGSFAQIISSLTHPIILVGLIGQGLLLYGILIENHRRKLVLGAVIGLALLVLFLLFVGILATNYKMVLSNLPFVALAGLYVYDYFRKKP